LTLNDDEIRARILQDIYAKAKKGIDPLTNASDYASLLGIDQTLANFHLQYLVESGLVEGKVIPSLGTTKKTVLVWGLTHDGVQAVEGKGTTDSKYNMIFTGPISRSQIGQGDQIRQQIDNSSIDVRDSPNTAIIKGGRGHKIEQHFHAGEKPIKVQPYSQDELGFMRIGKWFLLHLFGSLNPNLRGFTIILYAFGAVSGGVFFSPFVPNGPFPIGSQFYVPVELASLIALLVVVWFLKMVNVSTQTKCPKCSSVFSFTAKEKILTNTRQLAEKEVREYNTTYTCDNASCDHKEVRVETEEIPLEPESGSDSEN